MYKEFCHQTLVPALNRSIVKLADKYALFFQKIDQHFDSDLSVQQLELLELFGADELRKHSQAVIFLSSALGIEWSYEQQQNWIESNRVANKLDSASDKAWYRTLLSYHSYLSSPKKRLKIKTIRFYIQVADSALSSYAKHHDGEIDEQWAQWYITQNKGKRASLLPFFSFLGLAVCTSTSKKQISDVRKEHILLNRSSLIMAKLSDAKKIGEKRALTALAISTLYQIPLNEVLALKRADISPIRGESSVLVACKSFSVRLEKDISVYLLDILPITSNDLIFPSRNRLVPLTESTVTYHFKKPLN